MHTGCRLATISCTMEASRCSTSISMSISMGGVEIDVDIDVDVDDDDVDGDGDITLAKRQASPGILHSAAVPGSGRIVCK